VEQICKLKVKGQGHWERKCKNRFSYISSSKVDRFRSDQDRNDHRPVLLMLSDAFHRRKCLFLWYLSAIIQVGTMSQRRGCTRTCFV